MSNFLVILPSKGNSQEAKEIFHQGVQFAKRVRQQKPSEQFESNWVYVATFPRMNGSLCPLLVDQDSGDWVLVSGVWFHEEGWGSGQEQRLLKRIQEVGSGKIAQELEGFFVLVFGDAKKKEVMVMTDLIGSCHTYDRKLPGFSAISGSSLILASLSSWNLDPVACQEFLCTGVMYEDRTFYQEVRKLGPSTVYSYLDGRLASSWPYWQIQDLSLESLDGQDAIEIVSEKLLSAARTLVSSFPNPVCDLTGGYDSRMIVAAFLKADINFETTVSGAAESGDVLVSQAIASKFGLSHWHFPGGRTSTVEDLQKILFLTDGEYDLIEYANIYHIHRALMERYDIGVNGSFGEVARGYWWELLFPNPAKTGKLDGELVARKRYAVQRNDDTLFAQSQRLELSEHFGSIINRTNRGLWEFPKSLQMDHAYLRMRMHRWQGRIASSTNQIWPCLSPFMFRSFLEPLLQIRVSFRRRNQFCSSLIQNLQPELAKMPLEHGWPSVPFNWKTAYRFWPVPVFFGKKVLKRIVPDSWLAGVGEIRVSPMTSQRLCLWEDQTIQDLLNPSKMQLRNLLDNNALSRFLQDSKGDIFKYEDQWTKVVTMELTLSCLQQAKRTVNA